MLALRLSRCFLTFTVRGQGGDEQSYDAKKTRRREVSAVESLLTGNKVQEALDAVNKLDSTILQVKQRVCCVTF